MIEEGWFFFLAVSISGATAYSVKGKTSFGDFGLITAIGLVVMACSLPFIPYDKDGHLMLGWEIPYFFLGSLGAAAGCIAWRAFSKEQLP